MKQRKRSTGITNKPSQGIIALLTDFGDRDHYVGTVKGVILSINPRARIVDISHTVHPQNVAEAGYLLWASYRFFPRGTTFTCVVDPGVGSERKIVCIETARHRFIAPDNGLLDLVILQERAFKSFEILNPYRFGLKPISSTFHGRDVFAPLAAYLSLGKSISQFGKKCVLKKPSPVFYDPEKGVVGAKILHVDHFGNLVTSIPEQYFDACTIEVGTTRISTRIRSYAEAPPHRPCMIVGSSGLIEVVVREGSASETLRANLEMSVKVLETG